MESRGRSVEPDRSDPAEYYLRQRRFPPQAIDLDAVRHECRERYARLKVLAEQFPHLG